MDYFIVITTIFCILICLTKADNECTNGKVCMDLEADGDESCIQSFLGSADTHYVQFCNANRRKICCEPPYIPKTVSERKCLEWQNMEGFCRSIPLIANGRTVEPHSLPFMALVKFTTMDAELFCSGVLIERQWVLTAGHCFDVLINDPTAKFTVYLGAHNFTGSGIAFNGTYIVHEGYGNNDSFADLALIRLDREADITDTVKPACLVKNSSIKNNYFTAGWDTTEYPKAKHLTKSELIQESNFKKCELLDAPFNPTKTLCLKPKLPHICGIYSGGPIFVQYPGFENCNYELVALISEGTECRILDGIFTLNTRIDYYRDWIESKVWPNETIN